MLVNLAENFYYYTNEINVKRHEVRLDGDIKYNALTRNTVAAPGGGTGGTSPPPETRKNSKRLGPVSTPASTLKKFSTNFSNFSSFFLKISLKISNFS